MLLHPASEVAHYTDRPERCQAPESDPGLFRRQIAYLYKTSRPCTKSPPLMKITQGARDYADKQKRLAQKAVEFIRSGAQIYR